MTMTDAQHLDHEQLSLLLDERLEPESARQTAEAHLADCDRCRAELESLRATVGLLRGLPPLEPPRSFLLAETARPPLALRLAPWTRAAGALAAACFVVLVSIDLLSGLAAPRASQPAASESAKPAAAAKPAASPAAAAAPSPAASPLAAPSDFRALSPTMTSVPTRTSTPPPTAASRPAAPTPGTPGLRPWQLATGLLALVLLLASLLMTRLSRPPNHP